MSVLKEGSKGDAVRELQSKLARVGMSIEADGAFGPKTEEAVKEVQLAFGYDVDGIVGPGTMSLLDAQIGFNWSFTAENAIKRALEAQGKKTDAGALAGAALPRTLKQGLKGADVRYVQRKLNALGYTVALSGDFDGATHDTVKTFQGAFGYTVDGIVGEGTNTLLNAQIGYGWNATKA